MHTMRSQVLPTAATPNRLFNLPNCLIRSVGIDGRDPSAFDTVCSYTDTVEHDR